MKYRTFYLLFFLALTLGHVNAVSAADGSAPARDGAEQQFSSVEERRLLLALQQERLNLVKEREALENRKKDLKRLEVEVDKKLDQLQATRMRIEKLLEEKDAAELKKIKDLGKVYSKMSPEKAAGILANLDTELATAILENMKAKAAAKILNNMNRDKAAGLTKSFSTLK